MSDAPSDPAARPQGAADAETGAPLRDHAFDGIQEYDNDLPKWWLNLFYLTIIASVLYIGHFHFGPGRLGAVALQDDLAAARERQAAAALAAGGGTFGEEQLRLLLANPARIAKGRQLYSQMACGTCHGADGTGLNGPNLRDRFWIYGNDLAEIQEVVATGRIDKGMPGQAANMSADDIASLVIFIADQAKNQPKDGKAIDPIRETERAYPW